MVEDILSGVHRAAQASSLLFDQHQHQPRQYSNQSQIMTTAGAGALIEKSVIIHKDENGFGLRIKGQAPVYIEHVHENGAAWRAGVRALDTLCKVNGVLVSRMDHKDVVLLFKSCSRFVALTLMSATCDLSSSIISATDYGAATQNRQASTYSHRVYQLLNRPETAATAAAQQLEFATAHNATNRRLSGAPAIPYFASLMDRTNSCRSSAGLFATSPVKVLGAKQQQQMKLSRQDSAGCTSNKTPADKRLAVCICCRNSIENDQQQQQQQQPSSTCSQCQLRYRMGATDEFVQANSQQRQLHSSLKDTFVRHLLADSPTASSAAGRLVRGLPAAVSKQDKLAGGASLVCAPLIEHTAQINTTSATTNNNSNIHGNNSKSASVKSLPVQQAANKSNNNNNNSNSKGRTSTIATSRHASSLAAAAAAAATTMTQSTNPMIQQQQQQQQVNKKKPAIVNKRLEIIREFIDTERTHTERLRCLDELFYRPLREANFVSAEQLRMVFSSHRTLYKIHKQIYRILMSASYSDVYYTKEPLIGSALLEIFEGSLKKRLERASCSFCAAQATNTELLNKLTRRDTKAGDFLAQITSQRMVGRLGIKDLLASCFQRLTKYPLLLENLLKATPQNIPDDEDDYDDDDDDELVGRTYLRRSKSGLSAQQRRARMRLRLSLGDELDTSEEGDSNAIFAGDADREGEDADDDGGDDDDDDEDETDDDEDEEARLVRLGAEEEARRNTRRMMAISLAEEREFIERALQQSRTILVRVNESIRVALARNRLKEIWKRTDKYPGVPLIDITKQQVVHEGLLTLRLSKRSFDVYVLLLNSYIIILTREGQDKYRLKFFTPEGKSAALSSNASSVGSFMMTSAGSNTGANSNASSGTNSATSSSCGGGGGGGSSSTGNGNSSGPTIFTMPYQTVYSPVFVIDEHLTTRDAATDENGFYLLCKRKDDSRIYEFASRSPAERIKWREKIQSMIERQMGRAHRRPSCESTITKSSSEISANGTTTSSSGGGSGGGRRDYDHIAQPSASASVSVNKFLSSSSNRSSSPNKSGSPSKQQQQQQQAQLAAPDCASASRSRTPGSRPATPSSEPTKIVGTISYVFDDGIVLPSKMESSRVFVDQAIQVNILDGSTAIRAAGQPQSQQPQKATIASVSH